jgi:hypothetical protein
MTTLPAMNLTSLVSMTNMMLTTSMASTIITATRMCTRRCHLKNAK